MKSWKILAIAAVAITGTSAMAADGSDGKIAFGGQGGVVFSNFKNDGTPNNQTFENVNGFVGGAFMEFGTFGITLRPEINYVRTGADYSVSGTKVAGYRNNYLEIPLLVKINPFAKSAVSPFILVGPSWSKHLSTTTDSVIGAGPSINYQDQNFWSGVAGVGVEFNLGENVAMNVQARYNFGLSNQSSSDNVDVKSRSIYGIAGISFQN
ncbi:MAG: PorT family protein [Proteobacteria bacterium]|nr:MAG: PorT family protein [Pseudomonadota bacterium]